MKRIIVCSILAVIFVVDVILSIVLKYEALDVIASIVGVVLGLYAIYLCCLEVSRRRIQFFDDVIGEMVLTHSLDKLDDGDKYVYYAYSYLNNPSVSMDDTTRKATNAALLIAGKYNMPYDSIPTDKEIRVIKHNLIDFYVSKNENQYNKNFFFDSSKMFLAWGISYMLAVFGIAMVLISEILFKTSGDVYHFGAWLLASFGFVLVAPLAIRILIAVGIK